MFGWRKRIGYIGPTVMEVVPYEFYRFAPEGVGLVGVTCSIDDWSPEQFEKGLAQVAAAAAYLGSRAVDFIIHGGGPLVVARGKGYEEIIVKDIEAASKVSATTGVRAAMEACATWGRDGSRSLRPILSDTIRRYRLISACMASSLFASRAWMCRSSNCRASHQPTSVALRQDVIAHAPQCDALYLPCPQWQAAQIVDALEQESGIPAIAYSHASFFVAFRTLGLKDQIHGHGRLLASLAEPVR